jgi:hypothetical protein
LGKLGQCKRCSKPRNNYSCKDDGGAPNMSPCTELTYR